MHTVESSDQETYGHLAERLAQSQAEPFKGMQLTRADVVWLIEQMEMDPGPEPTKAAKYLDFRHAVFPEQVDLRDLTLAYARFDMATLKRARFNRAQLSHANFDRAILEEANFTEAVLNKVYANRAILTGALCIRAILIGADLQFANLDRADFRNADLKQAYLAGTSNLSETDFRNAHLEGANLEKVHFEGRREVDGKILPGADLRGAFFDSATSLDGATLFATGFRGAVVADIHWGDTNVAFIYLDSRLNFGVPILGDEKIVSSVQLSQQRMRLMNGAVRAYRQLALILESQGLNEISYFFAYRAQRCERLIQREESRWGNYILSLLLDGVAGYGFRIRRVLFAYFGILAAFALIYLLAGLQPSAAVLTSFSALHGNVFTSATTGTVREWVAAIEAVFGLGIESVIVAIILQRFFNK